MENNPPAIVGDHTGSAVLCNQNITFRPDSNLQAISNPLYLMPSLLLLGHGVPVELQIPVESTYIDTARISVVVLHRVVVDHVNHRADHGRGVFSDPV